MKRTFQQNQEDTTIKEPDVCFYVVVQDESDIWSSGWVDWGGGVWGGQTYCQWLKTAHTGPEPTHSPQRNVMTCVPSGIFSLPIEEKAENKRR